MRNSLSIIVFNFLLFATQHITTSYNILGIFPFAARSHYIIFDALMVDLASRGHNVTVYDTFPKHHSLQNYKQVDLTNCFSFPNGLSIDEMLSRDAGRLSFGATVLPFMPTEKEILGCQPLLDLRDSSHQPYDLLITETFHNDFFALFGHVLNVPVIVFHSAAPITWMTVHAGLPTNPSYLRNTHVKHFDRTNFFNRLENVFMYLNALYFYKFKSEDVYNEVATKFFGPGIPTIGETIRNASMLFLNTHYGYHGARPTVPNVVEVGGIQIKPARALPKDIEKFINESTHGVVYFSMGSLLRADTFHAEKRNAFVDAFAKLPQRVLWKWEADTLPGKSDNIMISKWMPQRDILAHPNVRLFVSHGGLLGTSEAVYEGVPILGIPIFGSQRANVQTIKEIGAGEVIEYNEISKEVVYEKSIRLLTDPTYKKNAVDMSNRFKDRPMSPLDTAVYWTEYVIRHKGAPHLKTAAVHMPWYQYLLLDVIAFLIFTVVCAFVIVYFIITSIFSFIYHALSSKGPSKSEMKIKQN